MGKITNHDALRQSPGEIHPHCYDRHQLKRLLALKFSRIRIRSSLLFLVNILSEAKMAKARHRENAAFEISLVYPNISDHNA